MCMVDEFVYFWMVGMQKFWEHEYSILSHIHRCTAACDDEIRCFYMWTPWICWLLQNVWISSELTTGHFYLTQPDPQKSIWNCDPTQTDPYIVTVQNGDYIHRKSLCMLCHAFRWWDFRIVFHNVQCIQCI